MSAQLQRLAGHVVRPTTVAVGYGCRGSRRWMGTGATPLTTFTDEEQMMKETGVLVKMQLHFANSMYEPSLVPRLNDAECSRQESQETRLVSV